MHLMIFSLEKASFKFKEQLKSKILSGNFFKKLKQDQYFIRANLLNQRFYLTCS
jgi:hypothetical protein